MPLLAPKSILSLIPGFSLYKIITVIIVKVKQFNQSRIIGPGRAIVGRKGSALRYTLNSHTDVDVNKSSSVHPCKYLSLNNMGHAIT